jgi:hypothetical protein
MENQDRYSKFDKALLAICMIVVLLCVFFMVDGRFLFSGDDTSSLQAVGEISRSENDVRQKHKISFKWRGIRNADTVFEGDSIFTGNESTTSIKFPKGGELKIDPKSLVVIRTNNGVLELDLIYGALSGDLGNQNVILFKEGERFEIQGAIDITDAKAKESEIGKTDKSKQSIVLTSPSNNALYWSGDLKHAWIDGSNQGPYSVEFSTGPSFKTLLLEKDTVEKEFASNPNFEQSVKKGNKAEVYWRVRSKLNRSIVSETRKVTVYDDLAPVPVLPAAEHIFLFESAKPETKKIEFTWTEPTVSQSYVLQVAKDADFKEVVLTQNTPGKKFDVSTLADGQYYWRVQGNHLMRSNSPWSEVRHFTVIERTKTGPPQHLTGDRVYVLPLAKVIKNKANSAFEGPGVPVTDYPVYQWAPVTGAKGYLLEVSRTKDFEKFAKQKFDPTKTEFRFSVMKPGTMGWRLKTILPNGEMTEASKPSFVRTDVPPPPTKNVEPTEEGAKVGWTPLIFANFYEVQWATDPVFVDPTIAITKLTTHSFDLPEENTSVLHWRVRALDKDKKPISAFSKVAVLKEIPPPPAPPQQPIVRKLAGDEGADRSLPRPGLREPRPQTSVVSFDEAPVFLNFKWGTVPKIGKYRFELSRTPDFSEEPVYTTVTSGDQLLINKRLPAGEFYWRVRGEKDESWTLWSDPAPFKIQFK